MTFVRQRVTHQAVQHAHLARTSLDIQDCYSYRFKDQKMDYWSSSPSLHPSRLLYICHSLVVNDGRKEGAKERETCKIDREQENVTEQEVTEGGITGAKLKENI